MRVPVSEVTTFEIMRLAMFMLNPVSTEAADNERQALMNMGIFISEKEIDFADLQINVIKAILDDYNTKDYADTNSVFCGHNMQNKSMFASLHQYEDS